MKQVKKSRTCKTTCPLYLAVFIIINEILAQDLIEILILEQSYWDFDENYLQGCMAEFM